MQWGGVLSEGNRKVATTNGLLADKINLFCTNHKLL